MPRAAPDEQEEVAGLSLEGVDETDKKPNLPDIQRRPIEALTSPPEGVVRKVKIEILISASGRIDLGPEPKVHRDPLKSP